MGVTIKELSERSGVKIPTIRYYERQGLLPEPVRTGTGQRRYGTVDVARLRFVRFGRELGMEVGKIRALIEMVGEGDGEAVVVLAEAVAERAERMQMLSNSLRSVSTAIIAGAIDEAGAFDSLMAGEGTEGEVRDETPPAPNPDATGAPDDHEPSQPAGGFVESVASAAGEPVAEEEPAAEIVGERDVPETPVSKQKRKRARARS